MRYFSTVLAAVAAFSLMANAELGSTAAGEVQLGYSEAAPWNDTPGGFYKKHRTYPPAGKGVPKNAATWLIQLPKGGQRHRVQATWVANRSNATNTPYSIFDDTRLVQTVYVNQQRAPRGTEIEGIVFQDLGVFLINSTTLRVVISNEADGTVAADTVRTAG